MHDQTLFFWGMVVTIFMLIAAMLTARELFDMYMESRGVDDDDSSNDEESHTA